MVDISKIELKIYSYRQLCELFDEKPKTHHSKVAQLKEWARYFRWSNPTTHKFKIEEIYEMPLPKIDRRINNGGNSTSKYLAMDDFLMEYFEENNQFEGTIRNLMIKTGLLSDKYFEAHQNPRILVNADFPEGLVNNILWKIDAYVLNAGKTSVERLAKDNSIRVERFIVFRLALGTERELNVTECNAVVQLEDEILGLMKWTRKDLYNKEKRQEFQAKMNFEIMEQFGQQIRYYYWKYRILKNDVGYSKKTNESIESLTRKFVKEICYSMLNISYSDYLYSSPANTLLTIELMNILFTYMNKISWDGYVEPGELDMNEKMKDAVFFAQYCLPYYHETLAEKKEKERLLAEKQGEKEKYRQKALEEIGEEGVIRSEKIIPNIDWEYICKVESEKDAYMDLCIRTLEKYWKVRNSFTYLKNQELAEQYSLYAARMFYNGLEYKACTIDVFEKNIYVASGNE